MILVSKKRVIMGLSFALLFTPAVPTKAYDNNANNAALVGCAIGAGILGLCGIVYGITQLCKKSNEQIAKDAEEAFQTARMYGQGFYAEYVYAFDQTRSVTLDEIESNFLESVAYRAQQPHVHIDVEEHIRAVHSSLVSLERALKEVNGAINSLRSSKKTYQSIYDRLVSVGHDIEAKQAYLNAYYQRLAEHKAYFVLYAFESTLHGKYQREIALPNQCTAESYQFEKQLLHVARAYAVQNDYPLVKYHVQLRDNIATLDRYIRELKYWYPKRATAAKQMLDYLVYIRDLIADTPVFKEERERKKEDDARQEMLALRQREVQAQATMAMAATQQAHAAQQQARAAQQRVYIEQARLAQQPTVVVVSNKC